MPFLISVSLGNSTASARFGPLDSTSTFAVRLDLMVRAAQILQVVDRVCPADGEVDNVVEFEVLIGTAFSALAGQDSACLRAKSRTARSFGPVAHNECLTHAKFK